VNLFQAFLHLQLTASLGRLLHFWTAQTNIATNSHFRPVGLSWRKAIWVHAIDFDQPDAGNDAEAAGCRR
jgi:hypothetical protein